MTKDTQSLRERFPGHFEIPLLLVLSTVLLGAGLSMPLMDVEKMLFWKNQYSVLTGITGLFSAQEYFLSAILFFFCLVFPIIKLFTLWTLWQFQCTDEARNKILGWLALLGKWSMLDVFVVAILVVAVKLGPMANVKPRAGVYIFAVAIILSIVTTTWIERLISRSGKS
jgi:paraquat-inducible protein A